MEKEKTQQAQTFDGGVTPEQVEAWKNKHRKVYRVDIVDGADTHIGYFKRPDFATIKAITKVAKTDEVEAGKVMFNNCWLGRKRGTERGCRAFHGRAGSARQAG